MTYKLKRCPFNCSDCDGKVRLVNIYGTFLIFSDNNCHIRMCSERVVDSNDEQAVLERFIEKWNSRTDSEELIEVECESVEFELGTIGRE